MDVGELIAATRHGLCEPTLAMSSVGCARLPLEAVVDTWRLDQRPNNGQEPLVSDPVVQLLSARLAASTREDTTSPFPHQHLGCTGCATAPVVP